VLLWAVPTVLAVVPPGLPRRYTFTKILRWYIQ